MDKFMRAHFFHNLPISLLNNVFSFIRLSTWLSLAASNRLLMRLVYYITMLNVINNRINLFGVPDQELTKYKNNEKKYLSTARYFLCLGVTPRDIAALSCQHGQIETMNMLLNEHKIVASPYYFSSSSMKFDFTWDAATQSQADVIYFLCDRHLIDLNRAATLAVQRYGTQNSGVIRALGFCGVNFAKKQSVLSESSLMHDVLRFSFAESQDNLLQYRFPAFLAMLESGSFPKGGRKNFLNWLDWHYSTVQPSCPSFDYPFPIDTKYYTDFVRQIEKKPQFEKAFHLFKTNIVEALNHYSPLYKKNKAAIRQIQKKQKKSEDVGVELQITRTWNTKK